MYWHLFIPDCAESIEVVTVNKGNQAVQKEMTAVHCFLSSMEVKFTHVICHSQANPTSRHTHFHTNALSGNDRYASAL